MATELLDKLYRLLRLRSLRSKLLLGVFLVLFPLLVLILVDYQQEFARNKQASLDDQLTTAQAVAALVDTTFEETLAFAWSLSLNPIVQTKNPAIIEPFLEKMAPLHPYYENLGVFDNNGSLIAIVPPLPDRQTFNVSDRAYFHDVMSTNGPAINNIVVSHSTGNPTIILATPLRNQAGQPDGVFVITLSLDYLHKELESIGLAPGQAILLIDPTGRAAFHSEFEQLTWEQRDLSGAEPVIKAIQDGATKTDSFQNPLMAGERMGAFTKTPQYGWVVGVTSPVSAALAPAQDTLRTWLIALVFVGLLSVFLALVLANFLSKPIRQLMKQTRALGRGELEHRVEIGTGDELEHLGRSFNDMASRLQRTLGDLQTILDSTENGIMMLGLDGQIRFANQRLGELWGLTHSQLTNCEWRDCMLLLQDKILEPDKLDKSVNYLSAHPEEKLVDEVIIRHPQFRILRRFSGPALGDGKIVGRIEIFTDVTEEKREERRREVIAETARALVEELDLKTVAEKVVDRTMILFDANAVGLWLADVERKELNVLALKGFPEDISKVFEHLSFDAPLTTTRAAVTGQPQIVEDISELSPDITQGRQIMVRLDQRSVVAYPLRIRGRLVGIITFAKKDPHPLRPGDRRTLAILSDIIAVAIENARLYQQTKEALHLRDEFLSAAAHELRTPVTALKGFSQLLLREGGRHTDIERRALEAIDRQCNRISRLTVDLFKVSEFQSEHATFERVTFDLRDVAKDIVREMQSVIDKEKYQLILTVSPEPVLVSNDRSRVAEVFASLIDAAVGRSPEKGDIEIEVFPKDGEGIGLIRDYGVAIPEERVPHVFEPFYEPIPAGSPGYRGIVLLGPFVSRQILERIGGKIWFESKEGGLGSTFFFSLPLVKEEERDTAKAA